MRDYAGHAKSFPLHILYTAHRFLCQTTATRSVSHYIPPLPQLHTFLNAPTRLHSLAQAPSLLGTCAHARPRYAHRSKMHLHRSANPVVRSNTVLAISATVQTLASKRRPRTSNTWPTALHRIISSAIVFILSILSTPISKSHPGPPEFSSSSNISTDASSYPCNRM